MLQTSARDNWFQRRFGPGAWHEMSPAQRLRWCLGGAAGALLLLAMFYSVLHQSVARADEQWARAPGLAPCAAPGDYAPANCDHAALDDRLDASLAPALRQTVLHTMPGARIGASPR